MDRGYDFPDIRKLVDDYGYPTIRTRGEESIKKWIPSYRARVGSGKNTFLAQQIQKAAYQMGKEN